MIHHFGRCTWTWPAWHKHIEYYSRMFSTHCCTTISPCVGCRPFRQGAPWRESPAHAMTCPIVTALPRRTSLALGSTPRACALPGSSSNQYRTRHTQSPGLDSCDCTHATNSSRQDLFRTQDQRRYPHLASHHRPHTARHSNLENVPDGYAGSPPRARRLTSKPAVLSIELSASACSAFQRQGSGSQQTYDRYQENGDAQAFV